MYPLDQWCGSGRVNTRSNAGIIRGLLKMTMVENTMVEKRESREGGRGGVLMMIPRAILSTPGLLGNTRGFFPVRAAFQEDDDRMIQRCYTSTSNSSSSFLCLQAKLCSPAS